MDRIKYLLKPDTVLPQNKTIIIATRLYPEGGQMDPALLPWVRDYEDVEPVFNATTQEETLLMGVEKLRENSQF